MADSGPALLADIGGINIVSSESTLPLVDIAVDHAPWDGVLRSLARLFDRRIEVHGTTYFLLGPEESLSKPAKLRSIGPTSMLQQVSEDLAQMDGVDPGQVVS